MIPDQHWAQKIFYFHVPSAWIAFLSYFIVMVTAILFLYTNHKHWDNLSLAAAEIGTLFTAIVLIGKGLGKCFIDVVNDCFYL